MAKILPDYQRLDVSFLVNYSHLKISGDPCSLIGSHRCDLFPSQLSGFTKTQQPIRFQDLLEETNQLQENLR